MRPPPEQAASNAPLYVAIGSRGLWRCLMPHMAAELASLSVNIHLGWRQPVRPLDHATTRSARQAATGKVRLADDRTAAADCVHYVYVDNLGGWGVPTYLSRYPFISLPLFLPKSRLGPPQHTYLPSWPHSISHTKYPTQAKGQNPA